MSYRIKDALRLETQGSIRPQRSDLPKSELRDRMDKFQPRLARMGGTPGFSRVGASTGIPGSGTGPTMVSSPLYYDPRWSSPDKFYFPRTEEQANSIWRHLYVTDPSSAVALDLYSQSPWSDFDLVGIDDKSIVHIYEDAISESRILEKLPRFTLEFLKLGKCVVHNIFDSSRGIWIGAFHHNPDNIKVTAVPWFGYEPLMDLRPTREMEWFASSPDRRAREITKRLPPEIVQMIRTGKAIPLDNSNVTYIGRKSADYELLGTSILTRLFRVQMLEDVLSNATIAVAQRNAAPLRIFKIGDPSTGWIPTDDDGHAEQLMELLAVAETDPFAAIVYHSGLNVEYVGVSDKMMSITREFDFIERVKMLALGISKSFLLGEASYACFQAGTPVMLADGTEVPIEDINTKDIVLDAEGKEQQVENNWCEGIPETLLEIQMHDGITLRVTPNHRFPVYVRLNGTTENKYARESDDDKIPEGWNPFQRVVRAKELREGDYLKAPRNLDCYNSKRDNIHNDRNEWNDEDYIYIPIVSVNEIENNLPVYNLAVENTHTYLVNGGIATCNSAVAGLQALVERLRSLREKMEQSYIYPKFMNPLALVHGFRERRTADLDHRVRTSSRHGGSDLIVPDIRWRKSLDPVQDQTLLATWQTLHEKGILSDRTYAIGSGLNIDIERKNLQEEAKWKASFAAKYDAGAEGEEAGGLGGLNMGAPLPGGEPTPEGAPEEAPEGGGGEARGSSLRTANGRVRVRPDDVASVRSILRGEDPDHPDWTGYLERVESKGLDHGDTDALDEHLISLGLTDVEITEVLRQAGLRRMPIRIGSAERDRRGFDKASKDLKGLSENGPTLLSGI